MRARVAALAAAVLSAMALVPAGAASVGPFSMTARQTAGSFTGTPVCSSGPGATDTTPDRVVVNPAGGAFLTVELRQTGTVSGGVHSRTKVRFQPAAGLGEDDWYNLVHHGSGGPRLLSTVEQVLSFDLGGNAPVGSMPAVGQPVRWTVHTNFSVGKQGNVTHSCEVAVVAYAAGDPAASGVRLADVAHAQPHEPHTLTGLDERFRLFVYPAGPSFATACNGSNPVSSTDQGDKGEFRVEPDAGAARVLTSDVWAFTDVGRGLAFNWRQRSPDLPPSRGEESQAGQRWTVRLPNGRALHTYQPVTWHFQAHWHLIPDAADPHGHICQGRVTVR